MNKQPPRPIAPNPEISWEKKQLDPYGRAVTLLISSPTIFAWITNKSKQDEHDDDDDDVDVDVIFGARYNFDDNYIWNKNDSKQWRTGNWQCM